MVATTVLSEVDTMTLVSVLEMSDSRVARPSVVAVLVMVAIAADPVQVASLLLSF